MSVPSKLDDASHRNRSSAAGDVYIQHEVGRIRVCAPVGEHGDREGTTLDRISELGPLIAVDLDTG